MLLTKILVFFQNKQTTKNLNFLKIKIEKRKKTPIHILQAFTLDVFFPRLVLLPFFGIPSIPKNRDIVSPIP